MHLPPVGTGNDGCLNASVGECDHLSGEVERELRVVLSLSGHIEHHLKHAEFYYHTNYIYLCT